MTASIHIRKVCEQTGMNPVTLRAWERGYGLINPERTEKGRRLYSSADIEQINKITTLIKEGIPVSQVQKILDIESRKNAISSPQGNTWQRLKAALVDAIYNFDEHKMEDAYSEAISLHPISGVLLKLIIPTLHELGDNWSNSTGLVSEEHFFRIFVRNKIGAMLHHQAHKTSGRPIIAACLPDEMRDLGLLMLSLSAVENGFRVITLGANTPLEEIPIVTKRANSQAVILSASTSRTEDALKKNLLELKENFLFPFLLVEMQQKIIRFVLLVWASHIWVKKSLKVLPGSN